MKKRKKLEDSKSEVLLLEKEIKERENKIKDIDEEVKHREEVRLQIDNALKTWTLKKKNYINDGIMNLTRRRGVLRFVLLMTFFMSLNFVTTLI